MKFNCKNCGTTLTRSLIPGEFQQITKTVVVEFKEGQEEVEETESFLPERTVDRSESSVTVTYIEGLLLPDPVEIPSIAITKKDFLGNIPMYQTGMGCCDLDGHFVRCHGKMKNQWEGKDVVCGSIVGVAYLDCWQTKRIELFKHTIDEVE